MMPEKLARDAAYVVVDGNNLAKVQDSHDLAQYAVRL